MSLCLSHCRENQINYARWARFFQFFILFGYFFFVLGTFFHMIAVRLLVEAQFPKYCIR